ncbi:MAG: hypothetical protein MSC31_05615 [Solirubrobacteraceae bacterium MAG38_C4-C5]|nr:hypothetical protein [Candidatus Siliceabacter maunaloa]
MVDPQGGQRLQAAGEQPGDDLHGAAVAVGRGVQCGRLLLQQGGDGRGDLVL